MLQTGWGICSFALASFCLGSFALVCLLEKTMGATVVFKWRVTGAIRFLWKSDSLFKGMIRFSFVLFTLLFPFLCEKIVNQSSSLLSLFVKDGKALKKPRQKRFALLKEQIALLLYRFQKQVIHTKTQRANSQPWLNSTAC